MEIVHKKNTARYLAIPMVDKVAPESFKSGETVVDTAYSRDGGGGWTALDIADTFAEIGATGIYFITLSAAEMNHDQVVIKLTSTNTADSMVMFKMEDNNISDVADKVDEVIVDIAAIPGTSLGDNVIGN